MNYQALQLFWHKGCFGLIWILNATLNILGRIVAASFTGGGNWSTGEKSLTFSK